MIYFFYIFCRVFILSDIRRGIEGIKLQVAQEENSGGKYLPVSLAEIRHY